MSRSSALCAACLTCLGLWIVSSPNVMRSWSGLTGSILIGPEIFGVVCFLLAEVLFILWQRERRTFLVLAGVCLTWHVFVDYVSWLVPNPFDPSYPYGLRGIFLVVFSSFPAFVLGDIFLLIWLCLRFREQRRQGIASRAFWYTLGWFFGFVSLSLYMASHASRPEFFFVSLAIFLPLFIAWLVGWSGDFRSTHSFFGAAAFSGEGERKELLGGLKGGGFLSERSLLVLACLVCFGLWALSTFSVLFFWIHPSSSVLWMGDLCLGALCFMLAAVFFILWQRERRSFLVLAGVCLSWVWIATYVGRYIPNLVAPTQPNQLDRKLYPGKAAPSSPPPTPTGIESHIPFAANTYLPAFWLGLGFLLIWLCLRFRAQRRQENALRAFWYVLGWFLGFASLSVYIDSYGGVPVFLFVSLAIGWALLIAWRRGWSGDFRSNNSFFGLGFLVLGCCVVIGIAAAPARSSVGGTFVIGGLAGCLLLFVIWLLLRFRFGEKSPSVGTVFSLAEVTGKMREETPMKRSLDGPTELPSDDFDGRVNLLREAVKEERAEEGEAEVSDDEGVSDTFPSVATELGKSRSGKVVAVDDVLRQSGCYVLGVQGVGKSSLLEQMIYQDIKKGFSVIVIDPHGDLIDHALAQMPEKRLQDVSLLSIEDTAYPFGLNLFSSREGANEIEQSQALDRVLHVFEKCFPETSRMLLEKYLGNIAPVFFAHATVGYGMTDIPTFLLEEAFREQLIPKARLFVRRFWESDYGTMSPSVRRSETGSLSTRLNRFMRSPIVGNIIGQGKTTIDFRKAIENKEILFVRLPIKTLKDDATLIGTMLVAQIHGAIFSFADMRLEDRPGFSLYVDEFQHFATGDFSEMFTEGRKFGARVTVAHQYRFQLPLDLMKATETARTKITFQTTQKDAPELAPLYLEQQGKTEVAVDPKPVDKLAKYASDNPQFPEVEVFVNLYLRQMRSYVKGGKIEYLIDRRVVSFPDPTPQLNDVLYRVQKRQDCTLDIPESLVYGFAGCGLRFFWLWERTPEFEQQLFLSPEVRFPPDVIARVRRADVRDGEDEFWRFLWCLRRTMVYLSQKPIGEKKRLSDGEVVQQILNLPPRHALVRIGGEVDEILTLETQESVGRSAFEQRLQTVVAQTRKRYCRPAREVEKEIERRLEIIEESDEEANSVENGQVIEKGDGANESGNKKGGRRRKKRLVEVDEEE